MKKPPLRTGKLPPALLGRLLGRYAAPGPGVVTGPGVGLDAAVLDAGLPGEYLLAKTDPITFTATDIGYYAVAVNANDIACMGGTPRWFTAAVILPEGSDEALVESIFRQLSESCAAAGASLVGGHTEITHGLDRPIVVGHMLGVVPKEGLITAAGAREGDLVILTKGIAVEAVSIIAREKAAELAGAYPADFLRRCAEFIRVPGISVARDARVALGAGEVHALHDPTEGGLSSGLYEVAQAAGVGMEIYAEEITVLPEARMLLGRFGLDPLGAIASGALIICAAAEGAEGMVAALAGEGIPASVIGRVREPGYGVRLRLRDGTEEEMPVFGRDEVTRLFE